MSGELAHARDEKSVHEADVLPPEHRDEPLRVAVEKIEEACLLTALLEGHEPADGRAVQERDLYSGGAFGDIRRLLRIGRRLDARHLRLGDEKDFLLVEKEREEGCVFVEQID